MNALDGLAAALRRRLGEEERSIDPAGRPSLRDRVVELVRQHAEPLDEDQREQLVHRVLSSTFGLGVLEPLLEDPEVDEVMINGSKAVFVERAGRIEPAGMALESDEELMNLIERILSPLGRRVDEASPLADARLSDGSRINCVIPPLSLNGPVLTIRRFRRRAFSGDELVATGTLTAAAHAFLVGCVRGRANLVVSGGAGSGKTTLLNVLSSMIDGHERIITIEDAAELRLQQPHVVRLECRPANLEGQGEVTVRDLVRNALRMRPDRLILGEVRGAEALDMLQALNTGHDGSMASVHANSAADALRRIETLALMAEVALPHEAVRRQLASALDVLVHLARDRDGARKVVEVVEVERFAGEVGVRTLFGIEEDGRAPAQLASPGEQLGRKLSQE